MLPNASGVFRINIKNEKGEIIMREVINLILEMLIAIAFFAIPISIYITVLNSKVKNDKKRQEKHQEISRQETYPYRSENVLKSNSSSNEAVLGRIIPQKMAVKASEYHNQTASLHINPVPRLPEKTHRTEPPKIPHTDHIEYSYKSNGVTKLNGKPISKGTYTKMHSTLNGEPL